MLRITLKSKPLLTNFWMKKSGNDSMLTPIRIAVPDDVKDLRFGLTVNVTMMRYSGPSHIQ